jgi:cytochrome c2
MKSRNLIFILLIILSVSCEEKEKKFVCGTCEDQMRNLDTVKESKNLMGKALFKANCASCHNASQVKSIGPGLSGVLDRIPTGDWKYHFIRNADSVIKSGDAYANAKFEEYNKSIQTPFPNLTNAQIDSILDYCN